jgi:hypothetical protein
MATEIPLQNYYSELAEHAGLAWSKSVVIADQQQFISPVAGKPGQYAYHANRLKVQRSYAKNWVHTDFRRLLGILETFDTMINTRWANYSKRSSELVHYMSEYLSGNQSSAGRKHVTYLNAIVAIGHCREAAKEVMAACQYLQAEMDIDRFGRLEVAFMNHSVHLDLVLMLLFNDIPVELRTIPRDLELLSNQLDAYANELSELTPSFFREKVTGKIQLGASIAVGLVILVTTVIAMYTARYGNILGYYTFFRIVAPLAIGYFGGTASIALLPTRTQKRIEYIKKESEYLRGTLVDKLKQVQNEPTLGRLSMLQSERNLYVDLAASVSNTNKAAIKLIQSYGEKLGKFEKVNGKEEYNLAGQIGTLINVFTNNVRSPTPTPAELQALRAALDEFRPDPSKNVVGWNFDYVFPGMKVERQAVTMRTESPRDVRTRFDKYAVSRQIVQFGPYRWHPPILVDINAPSHPTA